MAWTPGYDEDEVREAVARSVSLAGALRLPGLRPAGGNYKTLRRLIERYRISTDHLDPNWVSEARGQRAQSPSRRFWSSTRPTTGGA